jgi:hypothetical protein
MKLTPFQVAVAVWLVLMIGVSTMIAAIAISQYASRQRFLDRHLTPPPYVCTPEQKEAGECL